jgi:hypothetical protein
MMHVDVEDMSTAATQAGRRKQKPNGARHTFNRRTIMQRFHAGSIKNVNDKDNEQQRDTGRCKGKGTSRKEADRAYDRQYSTATPGNAPHPRP